MAADSELRYYFSCLMLGDRYHDLSTFSSGLLAANYGPDWPGIATLLAAESSHLHCVCCSVLVVQTKDIRDG